MSNFNLTNLAVNMYCPGNAAQLDDAGLPSIMVWIPAFRLCDVLNTTNESIHPAFIVNGVQIPGFWYSKYENVVHDGKAYSLPGEDPHHTLTFDEALDYSEAKGHGWHLSTAAEWAAIALWAKKNGTLPHGNNKQGMDSQETSLKAIPTSHNSEGAVTRVATGTGPLTWSHDGSMSGIWDMNGNVWEWQAGIRLVWGELQVLANNDAVDPDNPQNNASACWKAISAADGTLVEPECAVTDSAVKTSGGTVKLDYVDGVWTYATGITNAENKTRSCVFAKATCGAAITDAAKLTLRAMALLPEDGAAEEDYTDDYMLWNNSASEVSVCRGGTHSDKGSAGLFYVNGYNLRSAKRDIIGFRASYVPNI